MACYRCPGVLSDFTVVLDDPAGLFFKWGWLITCIELVPFNIDYVCVWSLLLKAHHVGMTAVFILK